VDPLDEKRLRRALGSRPFRFEAQVGSTNDIARQWAESGAPTGAVVVTEEQVAGRGRFGRPWSAPPGTGLLMSVILRPRVNQIRLPRMTMVGAVSVAEVVSDLAPGRVALKWPNDALLTGYKVAGVLPEAIWQGDTLIGVILGIGLNIRVDFSDSPLAGKAISVETVTNIPVDRAWLLNMLLQRVDYWTARIADPVLLTTWRGMLSTIGQRVTVQMIEGQISGQASGVDDDGALLLRADDGTIQRVVAGEVTLASN
jgi:BirA family biotin operon repressor/biotin-[acetyl-CoA-carboxylase] ligase